MRISKNFHERKERCQPLWQASAKSHGTVEQVQARRREQGGQLHAPTHSAENSTFSPNRMVHSGLSTLSPANQMPSSSVRDYTSFLRSYIERADSSLCWVQGDVPSTKKKKKALGTPINNPCSLLFWCASTLSSAMMCDKNMNFYKGNACCCATNWASKHKIGSKHAMGFWMRCLINSRCFAWSC